MSGRLVVRADASAQIGTGHVMRCLALAQAWQDRGGQATFVLATDSPLLAARLTDAGFAVTKLAVSPGSPEDAVLTAELAREQAALCVVLDGYHFDAAYQRTLKRAGLRLLAIDDTGHAGYYAADWVLNQNVDAADADAALYQHRGSYTQLLLGTRYALLRREFRQWRGRQPGTASEARKVLVTLGGSDPENVTAKVVGALCAVNPDVTQSARLRSDLEVAVVVGSSNPHGAALQARIQGRPGFRLLQNVSDMPGLMAWADVAISASGSTCWELAFMGLPSLLIVLADNQRGIATGLAARGAAVSLGWHADLTPEAITRFVVQLAAAPALRAELSARMRQLVDGCGADRALEAIQPGVAPGIILRPVTAADCGLVWEWANDPNTRAASFSSEPIPWTQHVAWFEARLADSQHRFYIALDAAAQPVGQIRYQITGDEATVSVVLAPSQRGRGYGSEIIRKGSCRLFADTAARLIHAYIKPENRASVRAFERAGYTHAGTTTIGPTAVRAADSAGLQTALHLIFQKEGQP